MSDYSKNISIDDRIIFALDVPFEKATEYIDKLAGYIKFFKIGLQLFLQNMTFGTRGSELLQRIADHGCQVMLDLKFYDIPRTISAAIEEIHRLNVRNVISFLTIGICPEGLRVQHKKEGIKVVVVTKLTSVDYHQDMLNSVLQIGINAKKNGAHGVVCFWIRSPYITKLFW